MQELTGKTVFITGGDSGIGLGTAQAFCEAGSTVVICGLTADSLAQALEQLTPIGEAHAVLLDVRDRDAFAHVAQQVEHDFGGVDILFNNAGVGFLAPVLEATFEQWDWVLQTNLTGVFNGIKTFAPRMLASGRPGHIIATASIGGMLAAPGAVYAAAKFGVVGLMEAFATELRGTDIKVSILVPGIVRTNIAHGPPAPGAVTSHRPGGVDLADIYVAPMESREVGDRVLQAIRNEDLYVFTHAEHGEFLARRSDAIQRSVPVENVDPRRAAVERAVLENPLYGEVRSARPGAVQ